MKYVYLKKRLTELQAIRDEDIDTGGIPELDDYFWDNAKVVMPPSKSAVSMRIDSGILQWNLETTTIH